MNVTPSQLLIFIGELSVENRVMRSQLKASVAEITKLKEAEELNRQPGLAKVK